MPQRAQNCNNNDLPPGLTRLCDADAAHRPRSSLGPPPSKTAPGKPCHWPCRKTAHLPQPPTGSLRSPSPRLRTAAARPPPPPQGNPCARRRSSFGLSRGLPRFPHRDRSAAGVIRFPLVGPPTLNERPAGEENISGDGRLMKNKARWQCAGHFRRNRHGINNTEPRQCKHPARSD